MITGPLDFTGLSNAASPRALQGGFADAGASEANFTQMFEEHCPSRTSSVLTQAPPATGSMRTSTAVCRSPTIPAGCTSWTAAPASPNPCLANTGAQYYGSSMARLTSQGSIGRALPASVNAGAWLSGTPVRASASERSPASSPDSSLLVEQRQALGMDGPLTRYPLQSSLRHVLPHGTGGRRTEHRGPSAIGRCWRLRAIPA